MHLYKIRSPVQIVSAILRPELFKQFYFHQELTIWQSNDENKDDKHNF